MPMHDEGSTVISKPHCSPRTVLKGQYVKPFRSQKGKLKGIFLAGGQEQFCVYLPKYLRPALVRDIVLGDWIQVQAYPEQGVFHGIDILPLPETEQNRLQRTSCSLPQPPSEQPAQPKAQLCLQVCCKGKCFKQGSRAILQTLQTAIDTDPGLKHISIQATGCMKACKQGPNLQVMPEGRQLHHASPSQALAFLSQYQS